MLGSPAGSERGRIVLIEAAMIDDLPIDVHTYGEGHPEFPDISTGDQLFNHADFDAYRILGREAYKQSFADIGLLFN